MNRFLCIHGHFYQPPRENPWLNYVESQDSAHPFHDWNERINAECYARNAASRILDEEGHIKEIVNNYARISFNFGPTLLEWMEKKAPETYQQILKADEISRQMFNGHGSAIAQAYNHMIMPLANERDKITQVRWGIDDFKYRFGRMPEGMWVGETAIDIPTLEIMAAHGIKFTVLSPFQALRVRKPGDEHWTDVKNGKVDPRRPYLCKLPSGGEIALFFYHGPVSQGIAFENLLDNGETFAAKLVSPLEDDPHEPQLMHIATDGETYGHHHYRGEMALSYALHHVQTNELAELTVYGDYLERFPPQWEAEVIENSSWSCVHGVERWKSNCGCNTGGQAGWNQEWRKPLRETFDWVRESLRDVYEEQMLAFTDEPWALRDQYIHLIHNRSSENVETFLQQHINRELTHEEKTKLLQLLEMQYHCMLMYTSCGWFFDEVSGIESIQDIMYAARALQLAHEVTGNSMEGEFEARLEQIPSNLPQFQNAKKPYEKFVKPMMLDLARVAAHYAVSTVFQLYTDEVISLYSYKVKSINPRYYEAGRQRLSMGRVQIRSKVTLECSDLSYVVLYLGDHHIFGGIRPFSSDEDDKAILKELKPLFRKANVYDIIIAIDKHYGSHNYSFWHLFRDEQRKILDMVLAQTMKTVENSFFQIYEGNYPLINALRRLNKALPIPVKNIIDFIIGRKFEEALESTPIQPDELKAVAGEIKRMRVEVDTERLGLTATRKLTGLVKSLTADLPKAEAMRQLNLLFPIISSLPVKIDLWEAQNELFVLKDKYFDEVQKKAEAGDENAAAWVKEFRELAGHMNLQVR